MPPSPDPVWTRRFSSEEQEALAQEANAGGGERLLLQLPEP